MHNKKKYLAILMVTGSLILSVGCSSSNNTVGDTQKPSQPSLSNNIDFSEDKNSIYGEILDINKGNITLALGHFNLKNKDKNETFNQEILNKEETEISNEEKVIEGTESIEAISLTGEEKVISITNDIKISKMNIKLSNSEDEKEDSYTNEQLALHDLSPGDIIKVNYNEDNTKIESVELISVPSIKNNKENTDKKTEESSKENEDVVKG